MLQSRGVQEHRLLTFLSDGGETVRNLPGSFHPQSVHLLDWFHLAMRVTVLGQYIKGLIRLNQEVGAIVQTKLASVKWLLWHGQVDNALAASGTSTDALSTLSAPILASPNSKNRAAVPLLYREQS
jgi:hypothetical protein